MLSQVWLDDYNHTPNSVRMTRRLYHTPDYRSTRIGVTDHHPGFFVGRLGDRVYLLSDRPLLIIGLDHDADPHHNVHREVGHLALLSSGSSIRD